MKGTILDSHREDKASGLLEKNTREVLALNGRHAGETVYIIGASSHLNELSDAQLDCLGERITIGLNRTEFKVDLKYFLSAYVFETEMAKRCRRDCFAIHMRPVYRTPLLPFIYTLKRAYYRDEVGLPQSLCGPEPTLFTFNNVALGATHLALVMGAKRIVYIAVQKKNQLHFYQTDDHMKRLMKNYLHNLYSKTMMEIDHPGKTLDLLLGVLEKDPEEVKNTGDEFEHIVRETFVKYFAHLRARDVEFISTVRDSILCEAGAEYKPLAEVL